MRAIYAGVASVAVGFALYACGSDNDNPTPTDGGVAESGANDGAIAPGDSGGDAAPANTQLLPLGVGHVWTYQVTALEGGTCSGELTQKMPAMGAPFDGGATYVYEPLCVDPNQQHIRLQGTGDRILAIATDNAGNELGNSVLLDEPVTEGHTWPGYTWHSLGSVTVPAGTFDDCWEKREASDASDIGRFVYCRGVGEISVHSPAIGSLNQFDAVLTKKNF